MLLARGTCVYGLRLKKALSRHSVTFQRLRQPVRDFIVIALFADKDVVAQANPGRFVEAAHEDGDPVGVLRLPEKVRSAGAAEAPPRVVGGREPGEPLGAGDRK